MSRGLPYQYQPLREQRSIRLLEILPDKSKSDLINCRIREVSLDDSPDFEAVSYVWGSATASRKIFCDDNSMMLTTTCWRMIRFMRLKTRSRFLWIDTCCIDQSSNEERNHQVGMMGDIYSNARRVMVWLGELRSGADWTVADENTMGIMRHIRQVGQGKSEAYFGEHNAKCLNALFMNSWFSRVWTVQEFALSSACVFMFGSSWFAGEDLIAVFRIKEALRDQASIDHTQNLKSESFRRFFLHHKLWQHIHRTRDRKLTNPRRIHLTSLLLSVRSLRSTEPSDKIFAFQGILAQLHISLPAPDYTKPIGHIYREAAAASILHDKDLMLLSSLTYQRRALPAGQFSSIPSWVPDWSVEDPISEVAMWNTQRTIQLSPPKFRISRSGKLLTLHGMIIDRIFVTSSTFPASYELRERAGEAETYSTRKEEVRVLQNWFQTFGSGDLQDTLVATFIDFAHDHWANTYAGSQPDADTIKHYWMECINRISPTGTVDFDLPILISSLYGKGGKPTVLPLYDIKHRIIQFHAIIRKLSDRKVMFRTRGGSLGIASCTLKPGVGKIALFSGCNLPMIIRPLQKYWDIVCPAYVQHAMYDCEAWTSGKFPLEEYTFA